ncbi:MAG TPA: DMT family transporter [Egibacteraceae bacterium]|nr:DMT family transporter [Egibacteraceae bacterium]
MASQHRPGRLPYVTALGGALCIAFSAILVRLADVTPTTAAVFRCAYALPVLGFVALVERRRFGPRSRQQRRWALGAGMLFAADLILWHYAIGFVGAGLATVLGNTQVAIVGVLAWLLLGERLDWRVGVSIPVVLAGVTLISGVLGEGAYGDRPVLGTLFGLGTGAAYAGFILLLRHSGGDGRRPAGPLFDATLVAAVTAALVGAGLGDVDLVPSWPAHGWLITLALTSQVLGWLLISISLPRLPAVITSLLLLVQPVGTVLLGMVLLSEAPSGWQLSGVAIVLAGILIATLRRSDREPPAAPLDAPLADAGRPGARQ